MLNEFDYALESTNSYGLHQERNCHGTIQALGASLRCLTVKTQAYIWDYRISADVPAPLLIELPLFFRVYTF